jgi:rare lipoprotein A
MAGKAARRAGKRFPRFVKFRKFHKGFCLTARRLERFLFAACAIVCLSAFAGCGGRKPIVSSRPTTPVSTPEATEEEAKRSTSSEPTSKTAATPPKKNRPADAAAPSIYTEEGNASWYGAPFHGRKASNGETYDMNKLTAAHRTLPFSSIVRVTNLSNGKTTTVRITDRGPFVDNRIIDLSRAAAQEIESIGPGVVPVRIEVLSGPDPAAGFFTVQVGAFKERGNADRLKERLSAAYSPIYVQQVTLEDGEFYRVRVGRVSGEQQAQRLGDELRAKEGFKPMVLRIDETNSGDSTP